MRVAFNSIALLSPMTGIGQYSAQIAKGLVDHPEISAEFFYGRRWGDSIYPPVLKDRPGPLRALLRRLPLTYDMTHLVRSFAFSRRARAAKFDLYHESNFLAFPFDGPLVLTVHDLSWIRHPETHPLARVRAMNRYFEPSLRRASTVLTISEFGKRELIDVFSMDPARIRPITLGFGPEFHPRTSAQTLPVLQRLGLTHGQYFLAVGTLEPRKNLLLTLRSYNTKRQR